MRILPCLLVSLSAALTGCDSVNKALTSAGIVMTFSGKVVTANGRQPIAGANVKAIQLISPEALSGVVRVMTREGGGKKYVRVDHEKALALASDYTVKTEADGTYKLEAPVNAYLIVASGPSGTGFDMLGVDPQTFELTTETLIGRDGDPTQDLAELVLSGTGPTPAPKVEPVTPAPAPPPAVPPTTDPVDGQPPMAPADPEVFDPPTPAIDVWATIDVESTGGTMTLAGPFQTPAPAATPGTLPTLELRAELKQPSKAFHYIVMQVGFDSRTVAGCDGSTLRPATIVLPLRPLRETGDKDDLRLKTDLVMPSGFVRFFFAQTAVKEPGKKVVATGASPVFTVGQQTCASAMPPLPFLMYATVDNSGWFNMAVTKYKLADVRAQGSAAAPVERIHQYLNDQGETLKTAQMAFDSDAIQTMAESPQVAGDDFCYVVEADFGCPCQAQYPLNLFVDVVSRQDATKTATLSHWSQQFTQPKWTETVGAFGHADCKKVLN